MNIKTNLLSAAVAVSFLTACGGSSSSSKSAPIVAPDPAPIVVPGPAVPGPAPVVPDPVVVPVPTPDPVVPLDYTLTDADIQELGKNFVADMDEQTIQLSAGLDRFGGSLSTAILDSSNGNIKEGLWVALSALAKSAQYGLVVREAGWLGLDNYNTHYETEYVLGDIIDIEGATMVYTEDHLALNVLASINYRDAYLAELDYTFTYIEPSEVQLKAQVSVSGSVTESQTGLNVEITNLVLAANALDSTSQASLSLEKIEVTLDGITASANASAEFVVAELVDGGETPQQGTLVAFEHLLFDKSETEAEAEAGQKIDLELAWAISALTGVDYDDNEGGLLNLVSLEISELRIEVSPDEYLTADSILFEDKDAADYKGISGTAIDSILEPITFDITANGDLGLAGGMVVPYQLSLKHPGAYNYQAQIIIGTQSTALTATFGTTEKDIVFSSALPFIPLDTAYAPTQANIEFSIFIADILKKDLEFDAETHTAIVGTLTVDGTVVAELKTVDVFNDEVGVAVPTYLEFVDGTYPESGGLFAMVEDILVVDCPIEEGVQEEGPCFADQSGVIEIFAVINAYLENMPMNALSLGLK